jgi:hypothetical protein
MQPLSPRLYSGGRGEARACFDHKPLQVLVGARVFPVYLVYLPSCIRLYLQGGSKYWWCKILSHYVLYYLKSTLARPKSQGFMKICCDRLCKRLAGPKFKILTGPRPHRYLGLPCHIYWYAASSLTRLGPKQAPELPRSVRAWVARDRGCA